MPPPPTRPLLGTTLLLGLAAGCGVVPRSKLDECHRLTQTLRSENGRLKDVALDLRAQNQDLSQRAVDDARRLAAQDEALQRLEKSVLAYQSERDALARAFDELRRQVRLSVSPRPSDIESASADVEPPTGTMAIAGDPDQGAGPGTTRDPIAAFAEAHRADGWRHDVERGVLSAPAEALFEPGTARLSARGEAAIGALRAALESALAGGGSVDVVGLSGREPPDDSVRRAHLGDGDGDVRSPTAPAPDASGRFLVAARGARVRDRLLADGVLEPGRVRLLPPPSARDEGPGDGPLAIAVRLVPSAGLDEADAIAR